MRELTKDDVTFTIKVWPETACIEDYLTDGDNYVPDWPAIDRAYQWIKEDSPFAWCRIVVIATWDDIIGFHIIYCVSYESEEAFRNSEDYADMQSLALWNLNENLRRLKE